MKKPKVHYTGGVVFEGGTRLRGWPVCCTGERATHIRYFGKTTTDSRQVTCKSCLKMLAKQRAYQAKHIVHWKRMQREGYCL